MKKIIIFLLFILFLYFSIQGLYKIKICNFSEIALTEVRINHAYINKIPANSCSKNISIYYWNQKNRKITFVGWINRKEEFFRKNPLDSYDILNLQFGKNIIVISNVEVNERKNEFILNIK